MMRSARIAGPSTRPPPRWMRILLAGPYRRTPPVCAPRPNAPTPGGGAVVTARCLPPPPPSTQTGPGPPPCRGGGWGGGPGPPSSRPLMFGLCSGRTCCNRGRRGLSRWSRNGEPTGSVDFRTEHDAVVLMYRFRLRGTTEWKDIRQRVPLTWTACALGGRRPWFRCRCGRRVAILYGFRRAVRMPAMLRPRLREPVAKSYL